MTTRSHILIVDPDEIYRRALSNSLTEAGHEVTAFSAASQAVPGLDSEHEFAILVTDPQLIGTAQLRQLMVAQPEMGLVSIGGVDPDGTAQLGGELGALGYISRHSRGPEAAVVIGAALRLRKREAETREYARHLEQVAMHHSARVKADLERVERMDTAREHFLANCSHELRTPLTPIIGWADFFKRKDDFSKAEVREFADTVATQSRRLWRVIESLLQTASLQQKEADLTISSTDVGTLLEKAAEPAREQGRHVKVTVCPGAEVVPGDARFLNDVLLHLTDNAVKFSAAPAPIELAAYVEGDAVVVVVADRGQGVNAESRDSVFQCFFQEDSSSTRSHGGLGLGLFISKELVSAHGGRIWVDDRPGGGASFRFSVPLRSRESVSPDPEGEEAADNMVSTASNQILVVDDDEAARSAMKTILESEGFRVLTSARVEDAREALGAGDVSIVLCDVRVQGEPALNLIRDIAERDETEVVVVTEVDDPDFARAAIQVGACGYVIKPFEANELLINVSAALHHRSVSIKEKVRKETLKRAIEERTSALKRAALQYQEARNLSFTDELTGTKNFRFFRTELSKEIERSARYGNSLSLLVFDIDHFKKINDRFGHPRGDAILIETANRVAHEIRPQIDTLARYGGEEFALILPETDKEGAKVVAERIRSVIADTPFETEFEGETVTISVGVSSYPDNGVTQETLFRSADWAMFRAKSKGRNRVWTADADEDFAETTAGSYGEELLLPTFQAEPRGGA